MDLVFSRKKNAPNEQNSFLFKPLNVEKLQSSLDTLVSFYNKKKSERKRKEKKNNRK